MLFSEFAKTLSLIETLQGNGSRLEIMKLLTDLFRKLNINECKQTIYLLQNRIAPRYHPIEFQFSTKQLLKVVSEKYNLTLEGITNRYKQVGDIGKLVWDLGSTFNQSSLNLLEVTGKLIDIAKISGKDSVKKKQLLLLDLFSTVDNLSAGYIARIIEGNLRLNMSDKTILDTFSFLLAGDKSIRDRLEHAFGVRSDLGELLEIIKSSDFEINDLDDLTIELFTPIASKLVERESDIKSLYTRIPQGFVQPKFDGLRCQAHVRKTEDDVRVELFSRNMESITDMFPEIVEELKELVNVNKYISYVFDSEIIGFDKESGRFLPFQETIQRKRKHDIEDKRNSIPVEMHIFDIMMLDRDLTKIDLSERISLLEKLHIPTSSKIKITETTLIKNQDELKELFDRFINERLEGLILKKIDSKYDPGTRNFDWIKFKRSSDSNLNDTIDGVILGYYLAKGQRTEFGLGTLLIGVYDKNSGNYLTITKVSSLTEEEMVRYKPIVDKLLIKDKLNNVLCDKIYTPDFWVDPQIVVEIEADEITKSENHTSGFSLRFPRIKYWGRDKRPIESTTLEEIQTMFSMRNK